ncbi:MAG: glycosyltransferase [Parvibaculum sp.]|nr:glycosyltransferase [Parvibaculum sp.]
MREVLNCRAGTDQPVAVLYVAVMERRKRHRELIAAMIPLLKERPGIHLFLAGDGPESVILRRMVEDADCKGSVSFLGFRDDIATVISAADICVFSSEREGLPRSIVQYAMCGKPIVATALPGIDLVVREGENGYVVPSDDFTGLVQHVSHLCDDAIKRQEMSAQSATLDFSRWDARIMSSEIELIYDRLLSPSAQSPSAGAKEAHVTSQLEQR